MTDLESTTIDPGGGGGGGEGGKCRVSTFATARAPRPRYAYHRPGTLKEVWDLLERFPGARLVAGGTDVMPALRQGALRPPALISLRSIPALAGIELQARQGETGSGDGGASLAVRIGALTSITALCDSPVVAEHLPVLAQGARALGSRQVRNRATVGGNLCNASPCADTAPPLLVLEARAEVAGPEGTRELPLAELYAGPGQTTLAHGEVLTALRVPVPGPDWRGGYAHRGRTRMDLSKASIAVLARFDEADGGRCAEARVAAGSLAPTPCRLPGVERALRGAALSAESLQRVAEQVSREVSPITDLRSTAEYRRELAGVLCARLLAGLGDEPPAGSAERAAAPAAAASTAPTGRTP